MYGWQYAFVSSDGELQLCGEGAGCTVLRYQTHARLNSVAFNPQGTLVYSGAESGEVRAWDTQTRGDTVIPLGSQVAALAPVAGGEFLIASNESRTGFFSLMAERGSALRRRVWQIDGAEIDAIAASRDGSRIASASDDRLVRVWTNDGRLLQTLAGHSDRITSLAFNPKGTLLASGSEDATVRLTEVVSGCPIVILRHSNPVKSVSFDASGALLATASGTAVRLWDARRRLLLRSLSCPAPAAVLFSPDGRRVFAAGGDGAIGVWDVHSGEQIGRMTATNPGSCRLRSVPTDRGLPRDRPTRRCASGMRTAMNRCWRLRDRAVSSTRSFSLLTAAASSQ